MEPARDLRRLAVRATWLLVLADLALGLLHLYGRSLAPGEFANEFKVFADLDREAGLGTWFASTQWATLAALLFALYLLEKHLQPGRGGTFVWAFLAAGALFLSADEGASIHELAGSLFVWLAHNSPRGSLGDWLLANYRSYYWALLYVPVALPAAVLVLRFLWLRLGRLRWWPFLGMTIFLVGAVVLDGLEGRFGDAQHGPIPLALGPWIWKMDLPLLEELFELLGVTMVVAACLFHASALLESRDDGLESASGGSGSGGTPSDG